MGERGSTEIVVYDKLPHDGDNAGEMRGLHGAKTETGAVSDCLDVLDRW